MKQSKEVTITQTEALIIIAFCAGKTKSQIIEERGITESTWSCQITGLRDKLTGGWKDDAPKALSITRQILIQISEIIAENKNPLIQPDVISSRSLMREIHKSGKCTPHEVQIGQALCNYGMVSIGRVMLVGERHYVWALPGIDRKTAAGRIHARMIGHR